MMDACAGALFVSHSGDGDVRMAADDAAASRDFMAPD